MRRRLTKPPPTRHHLDRRAGQLAACDGPGDQLISTKQLADWLGMSVQWCEAARKRGEGPPFARYGARIRYRRDAVRAWLMEREKLAGKQS